MSNQKANKPPERKASDVSKRKRVEEALRESEKRFRAIFEQAAVGVAVIDSLSGRFKQVNPKYCEITGLTAEAMIATDFPAITHPDDVGADLANMGRLRRGEISEFSIEKRYIRPDGSLRWVSLFVSRLWEIGAAPSDHIAIVEDITQRKQVEEALRESELKHRTLFETANDAILLMRGDRFIDCNARALALFGCSRDEILGVPPQALSPPTQPDGRPSEEKAEEKIRLALAEGSQSFEWEHYRHDGTPFTAEVRLTRLELSGQVLLQAILRDITERKRMEEALRHRESQLSLILNNVSDVIFAIAVNPEGGFRFTSVNRRFIEATGLRRSQVVGARVREVIPESSYPLVFEKYQEAVRTRLPVHWEEVFDYPAGRTVGQVTIVPVFDDQRRCTQLVGMVHDITERKEAEKALRESERQYRELVECANSIILRWTHEGRVSFLNEFGQRFFGYSSEELIGRHVIGTIVPEIDTTGRDLRKLMHEICADPVAFEQNVNENMRRNGERVWIAWTNRIVRDARGQIREILSIGTDVTERKRAQEAIRKLNTELEQRVSERTLELAVARDHAEAADRLKSAFLATMSHELRTPLNSIIGFTGIILQELPGPLNAEQRKQLEMVRVSARHLLALINDVLDISKIEAGQLEVESVSFDLRAAIDKAACLVKPLAESKGLSLRVNVARQVGTLVSDPRRVEQVLLNLLNNAVKFTERGTVTLSADAVTFPRESPNSRVRISVADTGIGIRPEDVDKLFQPFRQIDSGLARQHEGTGLGLAICRRLAQLMGGDINVWSKWGEGSVFTLTLPGKVRANRENHHPPHRGQRAEPLPG